MSDEDTQGARRILARHGIKVHTPFEDHVWRDRALAVEVAVRLLEANPVPAPDEDLESWKKDQTGSDHGQRMAEIAWAVVHGVTQQALSAISNKEQEIKWAIAAEERRVAKAAQEAEDAKLQVSE